MSPLGFLLVKFFGQARPLGLNVAVGFLELGEFGIVAVALFVEGPLVLVDTGPGLGEDQLFGLESFSVSAANFCWSASRSGDCAAASSFCFCAEGLLAWRKFPCYA